MIDPVCGMDIDPADAAGRYEHGGKTYFFCHPQCLERFRNHPEEFLEPPVKKEPAPLDGGVYTCPMDPEVRESKAGPCPKCGMALEPAAGFVARVEYTCPMHPEIVRSEPGFCPICGMALEPRTVTEEEEVNP
ncbi:MAG: heavy metal-binding domain-containing protein, partial [Candidatus Binatia bacterium]